MAKRGTEMTVHDGQLERVPGPARALAGIDRLFDDFFNDTWARPFGWLAGHEFGGPGVDVIDRDDEVIVRAALAGYRKEDIEVSVSGGVLTLSASASREEKEEKGNYFRSEIVRGGFTRTLTLPAEVDEANAQATMKDGMLELRLPKAEKARRRTIAIS